MRAKTIKTIDSVEKALAALDILAENNASLGGREIAERLSLPYGTVMCHLATLEKAGYIESAGGGYTLSQKLAKFWAKRLAYLKHSIAKNSEELKELNG